VDHEGAATFNGPPGIPLVWPLYAISMTATALSANAQAPLVLSVLMPPIGMTVMGFFAKAFVLSLNVKTRHIRQVDSRTGQALTGWQYDGMSEDPNWGSSNVSTFVGRCATLGAAVGVFLWLFLPLVDPLLPFTWPFNQF
jgi:hypothetical protein